MSGVFSFDFFDDRARLRVVFTTEKLPTEGKLTAILLEIGERLPSPEQIYFLYPQCPEISKKLKEIIDSPTFNARFRESTRFHRPPPFKLFSFDLRGQLWDQIEHVQMRPSLASRITRVGMTSIFRIRGGMLAAEHGYHYVNPSGKHSQFFLRVGNLVHSSAEVEFIAFACLGKTPHDLLSIYCDTGAIFPVAYAICQLRSRLASAPVLPELLSFESYSKVSEFKFQNPRDSLVLISASTSGRLARKIHEQELLFSGDQIVTLFSLSKDPQPNVICDLHRDRDDNPEGFEPFDTYTSANLCAFCRRVGRKSFWMLATFCPVVFTQNPFR